LRHLKRAQEALSSPVIASLSGLIDGDWTRHAWILQDLGAMCWK
jgi:hypothetical protein